MIFQNKDRCIKKEILHEGNAIPGLIRKEKPDEPIVFYSSYTCADNGHSGVIFLNLIMPLFPSSEIRNF